MKTTSDLAFSAGGEPRIAGLEEIRRNFPALDRVENGRPVAYFDGPGGTQVPRAVVEAMAGYLYRHNANTHWAYPSSAETDAMIAGARAAMADFVAGDPKEIAFGANMTTLTFHLSRALARTWGPGDEVVVTELDHHANVDPWRRLERERGITVRTAAMVPETGRIDGADLERAIGPRTKLVAIGAASNALGTINDLGRAQELARSRGALLFVDAVHSAPHVLTDVRTLGCDFLVCSAYKFYGPHVGVLWARRALLEALDPPKLEPAPGWAPEILETGTQNHEGIAGAAAAVDFLASLATDSSLSRRAALEAVLEGLHARGRALTQRLWEGLAGIRGVTVYGPPPDSPRTPTISFALEGRTSEEVARMLARDGVFTSNGDFYATTAIRRIGREREGVVRAGCAAYTTTEDVDRLLEGVAAAAVSKF